MSVQTIRLQHVRAHDDYTLNISPQVTVITGANGAGKTSIIEALYVALQGSSFKSTDQEMVSRNATWLRIDVSFDDDRTRIVKIDAERQVGRKQFIADGKTSNRLLRQHKHPVVLFEPDDLRLLGGSPARRRQFIDTLIGQIDPVYTAKLRRYERALKQRNTLLKRVGVTNDDLFAWNVGLSEYGAYIARRRIYFINELNRELEGVYRTISGADDRVEIRYSHLSTDSEQRLLADLHSHAEKDRLLGFTSIGPHRHDVLFDFNNTSALGMASRGEVRSIILALKFLEVHLTERFTDKKPIILLDDVFSELDETRQKNLVTEFTDHQIIITSVAAIPVKGSRSVVLTSK